MRTESWLFGVLLVATLGLAWMTWKQEEPTAHEEVEIFAPVKAVGVTEVRWSRGQASTLLIVEEGEGDERSVWVSTVRPEGAAEPKAPGVDEHGHAQHDDKHAADLEGAEDDEADAGPLLRRDFLGSARALLTVEDFEPFMALRRFEGATDTALEEMGFESSDERLEIVSGSRSASFTVGASAYGSDKIYLKDEDTVAYLVASSAIRSLRRPEQSLMERNPLAHIAFSDVVSALWRAGDDQVLVVHQGRHDKSGAFFAFAERPDERDSTVDGLMEVVKGLRLREWLAEDDASGITVVAEAVFVGESFKEDPASLPSIEALLGSDVDLAAEGIAGVLQIGRRVQDEGSVSWHARSDHTQRWVTLEGTTGADMRILLNDALSR